MVRNIDLSQVANTDIEIYNVIGVKWAGKDGDESFYSDVTNDVAGRILSMSPIDNVIAFDGTSSVGTVSVVLSDVDGALKDIYDNVDIHLIPAKVYQVVNNIGKFSVFEGLLSSNIVWSEGDRTLSFDIVSKTASQQVGFSIEDMAMASVFDASLIGKVWPMPFGTPRLVPAISMSVQPSGFLLEPTAIPDLGIQEQLWRLHYQLGKLLKDNTPPIQFITGTDEASLNAALAAQAQAAQARSDQVELERRKIIQQIGDLQRTWEDQLALVKKKVKVYSEDLPEGKTIYLVNQTMFNGDYSPGLNGKGTLSLKIVTEWDGPSPELVREADSDEGFKNDGATKQGFQYFNVGSSVTRLQGTGVLYIISCILCQLLGVYAYRTYNGIRKLTLVPPNYYTLVDKVKYSGGPKWFFPQMIYFPTPLSQVQYANQKLTKDGQLVPIIPQTGNSNVEQDPDPDVKNVNFQDKMKEQWEDDIYVDLDSSISGNLITIMAGVVNTFTDLDFVVEDPIATSKLARYTANFCLTEKKDALTFLRELAFQARCAVWIKDGAVHVRYLPDEPESVDTITETDIDLKSVKLTTTDTESLITRYIATYRFNYLPDNKDNYVIVQNNTDKYGVHSESVDMYAFNNHYIVNKVLTFWLLRNSNTWRKMSFSVYPTKLKLETMDCVTVDLTATNIIKNPMKGIIESANYNSDTNRIDMTVWFPILLGNKKQTINYIAWPASDKATALAGSSVDGRQPLKDDQYVSMDQPSTTPQGIVVEESGGAFITSNRGYYNRYLQSNVPPTYGTFLLGDDSEPDIIDSEFLPMTAPPTPEPTPEFIYDLKDFKSSVTKGTTYPGQIVEPGDGNNYSVNVFTNGLGSPPTSKTVTQLQINSKNKLAIGTWVLVVELNNIFFMQAPVWE